MEISRRHLQPLERAELAELVIDGKTIEGFADYQHDAELERIKDRMVEMSGGAIDREGIRVHTAETQERAAELQAQVDGMTRNQRRILNKRMAKAAKRK